MPSRIELPKNDSIKVLSLRNNAVFAISEKGELFYWGSFCEKDEKESTFYMKSLHFLQNEPKRFGGLLNVRISSVSCNNSLAIFLSEDGTLYSYGNDSKHKFGILGLGDIYFQANPLPVSTLFDYRIKSVSVGYFHACAVNSVGRLFTWGTGKNGQLGLDRQEKKTIPTLVESAKSLGSKLAVCSYNYTALLTNKGQVIIYGSLKNSSSCYIQNITMMNRLELLKTPVMHIPQPVKQLQDDFIVKLQPGEGFLACLSSNLKIFYLH